MDEVDMFAALSARCVKPVKARSVLALALMAGLMAAGTAQAARCQTNADGRWICSYQERNQTFAGNGLFGGCTGAQKTRNVRWQVPEGTPPAGGWPVVFFFQGTVPANDSTRAFAITSTAFGAVYFQASLHELLDDPQNTGKKYAVIAPDAPVHFGMRFWDTNQIGNYAAKEDACFFPDLFKEMASGAYGTADQYNMNRRFAYGISSGGYNTSRMAVSFNQGSPWAALAIVSASYATCAGPLCSIPRTLPANHPPTKFYHGTSDPIVPIGTMRPYFDKLSSQGIPAEKVEHSGGHEFTADVLGDTGIKAWFDRF
jgi:predicted esterase